MKPWHMNLRCYARKQNNIWVAISIDLNLVAQGDTLEEAKQSLHVMLNDYVLEACTVDKEYFRDLIRRRSPLSFYLTYYYITIRDWFKLDSKYKRFSDILPLIPSNA